MSRRFNTSSNRQQPSKKGDSKKETERKTWRNISPIEIKQLEETPVLLKKAWEKAGFCSRVEALYKNMQLFQKALIRQVESANPKIQPGYLEGLIKPPESRSKNFKYGSDYAHFFFFLNKVLATLKNSLSAYQVWSQSLKKITNERPLPLFELKSQTPLGRVKQQWTYYSQGGDSVLDIVIENVELLRGFYFLLTDGISDAERKMQADLKAGKSGFLSKNKAEAVEHNQWMLLQLLSQLYLRQFDVRETIASAEEGFEEYVAIQKAIGDRNRRAKLVGESIPEYLLDSTSYRLWNQTILRHAEAKKAQQNIELMTQHIPDFLTEYQQAIQALKQTFADTKSAVDFFNLVSMLYPQLEEKANSIISNTSSKLGSLSEDHLIDDSDRLPEDAVNYVYIMILYCTSLPKWFKLLDAMLIAIERFEPLPAEFNRQDWRIRSVLHHQSCLHQQFFQLRQQVALKVGPSSSSPDSLIKQPAAEVKLLQTVETIDTIKDVKTIEGSLQSFFNQIQEQLKTIWPESILIENVLAQHGSSSQTENVYQKKLPGYQYVELLMFLQNRMQLLQQLTAVDRSVQLFGHFIEDCASLAYRWQPAQPLPIGGMLSLWEKSYKVELSLQSWQIIANLQKLFDDLKDLVLEKKLAVIDEKSTSVTSKLFSKKRSPEDAQRIEIQTQKLAKLAQYVGIQLSTFGCDVFINMAEGIVEPAGKLLKQYQHLTQNIEAIKTAQPSLQDFYQRHQSIPVDKLTDEAVKARVLSESKNVTDTSASSIQQQAKQVERHAQPVLKRLQDNIALMQAVLEDTQQYDMFALDISDHQLLVLLCHIQSTLFSAAHVSVKALQQKSDAVNQQLSEAQDVMCSIVAGKHTDPSKRKVRGKKKQEVDEWETRMTEFYSKPDSSFVKQGSGPSIPVQSYSTSNFSSNAMMFSSTTSQASAPIVPSLSPQLSSSVQFNSSSSLSAHSSVRSSGSRPRHYRPWRDQSSSTQSSSYSSSSSTMFSSTTSQAPAPIVPSCIIPVLASLQNTPYPTGYQIGHQTHLPH